MRQTQGRPPLNIVGWEKPPSCHPVTHNLEWAIRAECQGRPILNYNTRLLGRRLLERFHPLAVAQGLAPGREAERFARLTLNRPELSRAAGLSGRREGRRWV